MSRRAIVAVASAVAAAGCGAGVPSPKPAPSRPATPPAASAAAPVPKPPAPTAAELQERALAALDAATKKRDPKARAAAYSAGAVFVWLTPQGQAEVRGRAALEKFFADTYASFPDLTFANVRVLSNDEVVATQWIATGTQRSEFDGHPASGKPLGVHGLSLSWIDADGLVEREHAYWDGATIAAQIGLARGAGRPVASAPTQEPERVTARGDERERENLDRYSAFHEAISKRDERAYLAHIADGATLFDYASPRDRAGRDGARKDFDEFFRAFPDAAMVRTNAWAIGDFVVAEQTVTATHKGRLGPIRATGKSVTVHTAEVIRVQDGKFRAFWSYRNNLELLGELGALPKSGDKKPSEEKKRD